MKFHMHCVDLYPTELFLITVFIISPLVYNYFMLNVKTKYVSSINVYLSYVLRTLGALCFYMCLGDLIFMQNLGTRPW